MKRIGVAAALLGSIAAANTALAWKIEDRPATGAAGSRIILLNGKAIDGEWTFQFHCRPNQSLWPRLVLRPLYGRTGSLGEGTTISVDGKKTVVEIDGFGEYGAALNEKGINVGMSGKWANSLIGARTLVLDGPSLRNVPLKRRSFSLAQAQPEISFLVRECGKLPDAGSGG